MSFKELILRMMQRGIDVEKVYGYVRHHSPYWSRTVVEVNTDRSDPVTTMRVSVLSPQGTHSYNALGSSQILDVLYPVGISPRRVISGRTVFILRTG